MKITHCLTCGKEIICERVTKKWCSRHCYWVMWWHKRGYPKSRKCLECGVEFRILTQGADANRKYCSERCSKRANSKRIKTWVGAHPDAVKEYHSRRIEKHPGMWREKARNERMEEIRLLGCKCIVCGIDNPNWLHIDYKPTTRGKNGRHARHLAFVREHLEDFRLLCANHHYELTITRKIEGTDITQ